MQMNGKWERTHTAFGEILRDWRKRRKISQLELSLDIGISAKHLSFVETGRSAPSRDLILRISDTLKLSPRHHNALLTSAGYVADFLEKSLDTPEMLMIKNALVRMLEKHEPYPAFVVNSNYDILMVNSGFKKLLALFISEDVISNHTNILQLTFDPYGLSQYIKNWENVSQLMLNRIWEEAVSNKNEQLLNIYEQIRKSYPRKNNKLEILESSLPVLPLSLKKDSLTLNFFTTITTLGTALDLTTKELRIEALFPLDDHTKEAFI